MRDDLAGFGQKPKAGQDCLLRRCDNVHKQNRFEGSGCIVEIKDPVEVPVLIGNFALNLHQRSTIRFRRQSFHAFLARISWRLPSL